MNIPGYGDLNDEERVIIDWQYRLCGDFKRTLFAAIAAADDDNLERLGNGFPIEVSAFLKFQRSPHWWRATCEKAGGDAIKGY
jgi:hypothetical protein